jgi:hypothetical protein
VSDEPDVQTSFLEPPPPRPMGIREYARHKGVSAPTVLRAIDAGRLKASIVRVRKNGRDDVPQIADVALADREWEAATDLSTAPGYVKEREDKRQAASPPSTPQSPVAESTTKSEPEAPAAGEDDEPGELYPGMSLSKASASQKYWQAKNEQLKYQERTGELVDARDVEQAMVAIVVASRTKLLAVPGKFKARVPSLQHDEMRVLDELLREAMSELATPATVTKAHGETVEAPAQETLLQLEATS